MLGKFNPFARLPNGKEVWAWGMYDLANQSFQLLINTLLFVLFVKDVVVVGDPARGASVWSLMAGVSLLLVVILSPVLGAVADQRAWKRELLLGSGVVCAVLTCLFAVIAPGQVWLAATLYIIAAVACGLGENFLASFLPEISSQKNVGYVSALGWTMSYVGALLLLGVTGVTVFVLGWDAAADARPMFVFAGLWFLAGTVPAMVFLREKAKPQGGGGNVIAATGRRLISTVKQAGKFRQLARFLTVFFIYGMSTQVVIYFLSVIGESMKFALRELVLFALVIAATAGIASAFTAKFQDRLGHKRTISVFLAAWVVATGAMAFTRAFDAPVWVFWLMSGVIGTALGGVGTASRALVGAFTPTERAAEFFGLWGMAYKLAGVVGVVTFGVVVKTFATPTDPDRGMTIGLFMLCGVFVVGLVLLQLIDEKEGRAAAGGADVKPGGLG